MIVKRPTPDFLALDKGDGVHPIPVADGCSLRVIRRRKVGRVTYVLVQLSLPPDVKQRKRSRILDRILEESGASGFIEIWTKGGIIHKPVSEILGIFILEMELGLCE